MQSKQDKKTDRRPFIVKYSLKQRKQKSEKQKAEKQNFIPLIIQKHPKSNLPYLDKVRYICEKTNKFIFIQKMIEGKIEKQIADKQLKTLKKDGKSSFFMYVGKVVVSPQLTMQEIYQKYKNEDGFLYITYGEMEKF